MRDKNRRIRGSFGWPRAGWNGLAEAKNKAGAPFGAPAEKAGSSDSDHFRRRPIRPASATRAAEPGLGTAAKVRLWFTRKLGSVEPVLVTPLLTQENPNLVAKE